jgi:hypothetical protein
MLCKYLCVLETKEALVAEGNICFVKEKSVYSQMSQPMPAKTVK